MDYHGATLKRRNGKTSKINDYMKIMSEELYVYSCIVFGSCKIITGCKAQHRGIQSMICYN